MVLVLSPTTEKYGVKQHFLLFYSQCFQEASVSALLKDENARYRVNSCFQYRPVPY